MATLEETLANFIARDYGVNPEDVNDEFIREKRKELHLRPDFRFEVSPGKFMTTTEIEAMEDGIRERADAFMDQFR